MLHRKVIVRDYHGLRLRPAVRIDRACRGIDSKVTISKGKEVADASSILEILLLDAGPGSSLEIRAEGIEEEIAIRRVLGLF